MKAAVAIAATDPTAGAGLLADVKTFAAFGVYSFAVASAVTVQSRAGVASVHPVAADVVEAQLRAVFADVTPAVVKIGMLATAANAEAVSRALAGVAAPVVLDPVLASSGGAVLLEAAGLAVLGRLLPRCALVTPNLAEAEALSGVRIAGRSDMESAARRLAALGAGAVLVKGGHLEGAPADLLLVSGRARWLEGDRIGADLHGTGCALASAVAAGLALGRGLEDAALTARAYVRELLLAGSAIPGPGRALADHLAPFRARALGSEGAA